MNYTTPTDDQYINIRVCNENSANVKVVREIGKYRNFFDCNSDIAWFGETEDFSIMTYEPDELSFDRADIEANLALKQTEAGDGSIEWTKEIGIKAQYGSKFLQSILNDYAQESLNGDNGKGFVAMANGGIWYRETIIYNEGQTDEFRTQMVYPNLKVETWPVPFSGIINAETEYTIGLIVENWPVPFWEGTAPIGYGLPSDVDPITITYDTITLVGQTLTITALTLTDTNTPSIIDSEILKPVRIEAKSELGESFTTEFAGTNEEAILTLPFTPTGTLDVIITWIPMQEKSIPYQVVKVPVTP